MLYYLIGLDFIWAAIAFAVDFPKAFQMPFWAVPFAFICPIYPLLLAFIWIKIAKKKKTNGYLLAFAVLPSAVFAIMALIFYPALSLSRGFRWDDLGEILWVLFYGIQGWYFLNTKKLKLLPVAAVVIYLLVNFSLDLGFLTFSYLEVESLSTHGQKLIYASAVISTVFVGLIAFFTQPEKLSQNNVRSAFSSF